MNSSVRPATSEELDFLSAQKNSQFRETFLRLCQNRAAVAGMIFLIFLILMAVFADVLFDYQTTCVDQNIAERLQWPSAAHWFGTDQFGRDLLARIVHGSRVSLSIGFIAVAFGLVVGGILGAVAGFFGGAVTVTGLIAGCDLVRDLAGRDVGTLLIVESMLRAEGDKFLDDMTLEELRGQLGAPVCVLENTGEALAEALRGILDA